MPFQIALKCRNGMKNSKNLMVEKIYRMKCHIPIACTTKLFGLILSESIMFYLMPVTFKNITFLIVHNRYIDMVLSTLSTKLCP